MHYFQPFMDVNYFTVFIYKILKIAKVLKISSTIIFEICSWMPATAANFKKMCTLISSHDNSIYKLV